MVVVITIPAPPALDRAELPLIVHGRAVAVPVETPPWCIADDAHLRRLGLLLPLAQDAVQPLGHNVGAELAHQP